MGGRGSSSGKAGSGASQWEQTYKTQTVYGVTYEGFRLGNMEIQGSAGLYRVFDTSTKRGSKKPKNAKHSKDKRVLTDMITLYQ